MRGEGAPFGLGIDKPTVRLVVVHWTLPRGANGGAKQGR